MHAHCRCGAGLLCVVLVGLLSPTADALINLEWRCDTPVVGVGDTLELNLYAVSDSTVNQSLYAMDVILTWDPGDLTLLGNVNKGPYVWPTSTFPAVDPHQLNLSFADGMGQLGNPAWATPAGLLITTIQFSAEAWSPVTSVAIPIELNGARTKVYDGLTPNRDVHGTLDTRMVTIVPEPETVLTIVLGLALVLRCGR